MVGDAHPTQAAASQLSRFLLLCLLWLSLANPASAELLQPEQAFRFSAKQQSADSVLLSWDIAEGYYLYRKKLQFNSASPGLRLGPAALPPGQSRQDEFFGEVEVYRHQLSLLLPLQRDNPAAATVELQIGYQGCADAGVCYLPERRTVSLELPEAESILSQCLATLANCTDRIAGALQTGAAWPLAASFFGFGLLMAFSPCIFPMIPILSGLIVGHGGRQIGTARAFGLSLSYVLAAAATYTGFGILAGLFGGNLQADFQNPWIIAAFSGVFVLLALPMFGLFTLQMPAFIQTRANALSQRQHGGTWLGAAAMGAFSALIVGPCMAAPLAGALIYIGQTGDAVLGGMALFAMGLGMGVPLLAIGTSAGKLLPKAGAWMNAVKSLFGLGLLAVAVWLLERILPATVTGILWALLLIVPALFLGAQELLLHPSTAWRNPRHSLGAMLLAAGSALLASLAAGCGDPWQALRGQATACAAEQTLAFQPAQSQAELQQLLASAHGRWAMLDIYADWCTACKDLERSTFTHPAVQTELGKAVLLRADVTANTAEQRALLHHLQLVGPPALLFFAPDGQENKTLRVVGYLDSSAFLRLLREIPL